MHAGHFIPRSVGGLSLFFHEENVHAQCATCNLFLQGNQYEYGRRLGEAKVTELQLLKRQTLKVSESWYLDKIQEYNGKLSNMRQDNGVV